MNIDVCKQCKHCEQYGDEARRHYHCALARPVRGGGYTADNPTSIVAEEFTERVKEPGREGAPAVSKRRVAVKPQFKCPAACPFRSAHG